MDAPFRRRLDRHPQQKRGVRCPFSSSVAFLPSLLRGRVSLRPNGCHTNRPGSGRLNPLNAEPAMNLKRASLLLLLAVGTAATVSACATLQRGPVGNSAVPQPAKAVDLTQYRGLWYEIGRYENGFERGCEAVTARY